jgi:hypothetical protein
MSAVVSPQGFDEALGSAVLNESQESLQPVRVEAAPRRQAQAQSSQYNKMESFLGLDVISHMDAMETKNPDDSWGAVGWGPDKGK